MLQKCAHREWSHLFLRHLQGQMVSYGHLMEPLERRGNFYKAPSSKKGWSTALANEQEDGPSQNMKTDFQTSWACYNYPGVKMGPGVLKPMPQIEFAEANMVLLQKKYLNFPIQALPQKTPQKTVLIYLILKFLWHHLLLWSKFCSTSQRERGAKTFLCSKL